VEQEEDKENDKDISFKSEYPLSFQGAFIRKCKPLYENSAILSIEAIEPLQADVNLLD
jgi:hypothetical protein